MAFTLTVNGVEHTVDVADAKPLLWVLREDLGLPGTKFGCGIGLCRACFVLVDGQPRQSCIYPASTQAGRDITTIEGLDDELSETLREAWADAGASQCGYCQPGQIVSAYALLTAHDAPSDATIDAEMRNICRCGTYQRIRAAIHDAASRRSR